ncbi:MAG: hypothetical protein GY859_30665 [Desulfobacterales bacterium]|nr:hypothetical protein [Desulfobacterales bacterium]
METVSRIRPRLRVLSDEQVERIHRATLEVLERTGLRISHPRALVLLADAGARIVGKRVHIPARVAEEVIGRPRSPLVFGDRRGEPAVFLGEDRAWFGAGLDCLDYLDPVTDARRPFTLADLRVTATIANALPNYSWAMTLGLAADAEPAVMDRVVVSHAMTFCEKPLVFCCNDIRGLIDIYKMARLVVGNGDRFSKAPNIIHVSSPVSPLAYHEDTVERIIFCAEHGIPQIFYPGIQAGATSPATFAGVIVQGSAESLAGLILAQLVREDAPVVYGAFTTIMDMRTTIFSYGAAEMNLMNAALAQMSKYYNVPYFGTGGCSDAKFDDDPQAVVEATFSCLNSALSGADLVHDIGLLDHSTLVSPNYLVLINEAISMINQYMNGVSVSDETLALDVIHRVGPGGHFLTEDHTAMHCREVWYSELFDRSLYDDWIKQGGKRFKERLGEMTRGVMRAEGAPLSPEITEEMERMAKKWR